MENAITVNLTPLQVFLSLAFQIWLIVFPIILIRKLNYLTTMMQEHFSDSSFPSSGNQEHQGGQD